MAFLQALGIQDSKGVVKRDKKDKFIQINRFLEIIYPYKDRCQSVVDFGCGKGYLTFALYHELKKSLQTFVGVDIKRDVIANLNQLASQLHFNHLKFVEGTILAYEPEVKPDLVIALHACNRATDEAIFQAIQWQSQVILVAPCCHQESFGQIQNEPLTPLLRHGILKERLAALATDAARLEILTQMGYRADILEFIDSEHTAKNLMIRAVKTGKPRKALKNYQAFCQSLSLSPYLDTLLNFSCPYTQTNSRFAF